MHGAEVGTDCIDGLRLIRPRSAANASSPTDFNRRAVVEGLCQFEELIEGTRVALERLLPQPQQGGFLSRHPASPFPVH